MKPALAGIGNAFVVNRYGYTRVREWVIVTAVLLVIAGGISGLVYGITKAVRSAGAASCRTFAGQSGYPSHYKIQHFLDGGTCYVKLPNGHALPQKMVVAYLKANKLTP